MTNASVPEDCTDLRKDEWEALQSIFPDFTTGSEYSENILKVQLDIPIRFSSPKHACLSRNVEADSDNADDGPSEINISLSSLPPLLLEIILPMDYPYAAPDIRSVGAASWLSSSYRSKLCGSMLSQWHSGEGILYDWITSICTGRILQDVGIEDDSGCLRLTHFNPQLLCIKLQSFDSSARLDDFSSMTFLCEVCVNSFKGSKCFQLHCSHIFCKSCLEDYWSLYILEGNVDRVGCPDPECVKEKRLADEEEVSHIVKPDNVKRWRWLRERSVLERDPTIIYCPISFCQSAVRKPENVGDTDTGWDRLRTCDNCGYSFCAFCRRGWHGPITHCPISASEAIVLEYLALSEGSEERTKLEYRYGLSNIKRLITTYKEEKLNAEFIAESSTECPGCKIKITKSLGCNHITCIRCQWHFCYRCGQRLDAKNPYKHFSDVKQSRCYQKLFDDPSVDDDEWQPIEGFNT